MTLKVLAGALAACLLGTSTVSSAAPGDALYTHPGQLVSAGARLNLYCTGHGSPAVVFDSGFEDWAPAWAVVQPRIARFTRACSYDRAGAGFSTPGPVPRTTSPAGSFPSNGFGLSDMIGNVWQWTKDCAEDCARTPRDGAPAKSGDCSKHIVRGGGSFHGPDSARSASRVADDAGRRAADIGFRVAAENN